MDSNHDQGIQSPLCYHYTTRHLSSNGNMYKSCFLVGYTKNLWRNLMQEIFRDYKIAEIGGGVALAAAGKQFSDFGSNVLKSSL